MKIFNNRTRGIFILLIVCGCGQKQPATQQVASPVTVSTYRVHLGTASYFEEYPATVTPLNEVEIRAQVAGYITGIYFKDGQHVRRGQKLYTIDQQQYAASYQQSSANMEVAKANLARAQQDADRYQELAKNDAIARQTLDHALADLRAAHSQLAAAQANRSAVQTSLKYSTISAPLDGTIGISQVKVGTAVSPGQMVLNTISSDNPIAVDFNVDEKHIYRFIQLKQNGSNPKDSVFTLSLSDGSIYPEPGKIALIDRAVDPQTGTIKARLVFNNKANSLRPGMNCNVRVLNNGSAPQLLIPYKAVVEQMGEYFVYVLGDSSKVTQRKIVLGPRIKDTAVVNEGLAENDIIVTEGVQKLRDGTTVSTGSELKKS